MDAMPSVTVQWSRAMQLLMCILLVLLTLCISLLSVLDRAGDSQTRLNGEAKRHEQA